MIDCRKHEPNIAIQLPGWDEICTDVLALPIRIQTRGFDGCYHQPEDGEFGAASWAFSELYHGRCEPSKLTLISGDGTREDQDGVTLDEDMLVRRIYGQTFEPELRAAFAKCLRLLAVDPDETITLGERIFAEYTQQEAERVIAEGQAMAKVDDRYDEYLPKYLEGDVLKHYRRLLMRMTMAAGKVPEVLGITSPSNDVYLAVKDIEAVVDRRFPGGPWTPDYVTKVAGLRWLSLSALMLFSLGPLQKLYFENENNEAVNSFHSCCCRLQYSLMNSTPEGRQVLDKMTGGLFGKGAIESDPE